MRLNTANCLVSSNVVERDAEDVDPTSAGISESRDFRHLILFYEAADGERSGRVVYHKV